MSFSSSERMRMENTFTRNSVLVAVLVVIQFSVACTKPEIETYSIPFDHHLKNLFPLRTKTAIKRYYDFYSANVYELAHLYDGIKEALTIFKNHGYRLALLSDKHVSFGQPELIQSGLDVFLDFATFRADHTTFKPDPQRLLDILITLSANKNQTLYVGDSPVDIQCAFNAGVRGAAALWSALDQEATLKECPDYAWHTVRQMQDSLKCRSTDA